MKFQLKASFLLSTLQIVTTARILACFVYGYKSHHNVFQPILRELSLKGHSVTIITPLPINDKTLVNITEIDVSSEMEPHMMLSKSAMATIGVTKIFRWVVALFMHKPLSSSMIQSQFKHPQVRKLLDNDSQEFDVVIVEPHPLLLTLGARFKCPIVQISPHYAHLNEHLAAGNPTHPITAPEAILGYLPEQMGFWKRFESVVYSLVVRFVYKYVTLPLENRVAQHYFNYSLPPLQTLHKNISLLLINSNPLLYGVRSNVPTVIDLVLLQRPKTLAQTIPLDLQHFLDKSTQGVIYFSLGSILESSEVLRHKFQDIMQAFSEIPHNILWKFEKNDTSLNELPNVMLMPWVPQMYVLKHPNVRAFITACGPLSVEETAIARVPIIAMPLSFDQFLVTEKAMLYGIGRKLSFRDLNKEDLKEAILDVANNPSYKKNVEKFGDLMEDQAMTGLDTAIWWIEYVIRHKRMQHLRNPEAEPKLLQIDILWFAVALVGASVLFSYPVIGLYLLLRNKLRYNYKVD